MARAEETGRRKRGTSTSSFGVGRRESHDSSPFYARFNAPFISSDDRLERSTIADVLYCADSRKMEAVPSNSVALVVTSPPYFAGKEYEEALGEGHVPDSYVGYLQMLEEVFSECARVLEPGGRIAVNVANLGRKPYRSLSSDVIAILQDRLGLLLRGEIIWLKARGASGSCAWGSFQSPANPVLRDLTERVIVASKSRFNRAVSGPKRSERGLPSEATMSKEDFMEATIDVWEIPPESATRVGHPAPFPVELPRRLIELYTYRGDVVLDPFIGSGSSAIAALRTDRRYVGYDTDPGYLALARDRIESELRRLKELEDSPSRRPRVAIPAIRGSEGSEGNFQSRAVREGRMAKDIAAAVLKDSGFADINESYRFRNGVEVNFIACDQTGRQWFFDVSGAFTTNRGGLRRTDTLWKALGRAAVLRYSDLEPRLVLLTTDLPPKGSAGHSALVAARGELYFDAIEMLSEFGQEKLRKYATGHQRKAIGSLDDQNGQR